MLGVGTVDVKRMFKLKKKEFCVLVVVDVVKIRIYIYISILYTIGSLIRTVQMVLYLNRVGHISKLKYRLRLGLDRNGRQVER